MSNIFNRKCETCKYARFANNEDYVGCIAGLNKIKQGDDSAIFDFYQRDEIKTGWVNLQAPPDDDNPSGLITNGIPCFLKTDICKHYKVKE